ncbi:hypothetical protein GALMADRAFT_210647 [Galerina marginata CBS 339.88]|uniref:Uncharacterized protein n=1 Tax=Galerina marginata (strain CBS 339.88) TaxID=685588 RepID=A0A067TA49_GALM3|nr:hypothetical protein GALMADRAFT_210647 [Galerina marginata CBS 339.88]
MMQSDSSLPEMDYTLAWLDTCYPDGHGRGQMELIVERAMAFLWDDLVDTYGWNAVQNSTLVVCSDFHSSDTARKGHHHWTARLHRPDGYYLGGMHIFHPLNPDDTPEFQDRKLDRKKSPWVQKGLAHVIGRLRHTDGTEDALRNTPSVLPPLVSLLRLRNNLFLAVWRTHSWIFNFKQGILGTLSSPTKFGSLICRVCYVGFWIVHRFHDRTQCCHGGGEDENE